MKTQPQTLGPNQAAANQLIDPSTRIAPSAEEAIGIDGNSNNSSQAAGNHLCSRITMTPASRQPNIRCSELASSKLTVARRQLLSRQQQAEGNSYHYPYRTQRQSSAGRRQQPRRRSELRSIKASEYKNLRQVVPSLRRQRDVGKVELVTEAARYIDHLHKTLIERFVLCGIPDSLKGTADANELNSQHIMNLVTEMAANQRRRVIAPISARQTARTPSTRRHKLRKNNFEKNARKVIISSRSRQQQTQVLAPQATPLTGSNSQAAQSNQIHRAPLATRRSLPVASNQQTAGAQLRQTPTPLTTSSNGMDEDSPIN